MVQKLRLRYAKRGRLRFSSHRDFQRALERALRRCDVPMAYSAGFTPHPKISYAGAAPTGVASEAEYVEIGVSTRCDPAAVREALDEALPAGLDIVDVVESGGGALADLLQASLWRIVAPGLTSDDALRVATEFLAREEVAVERLMKSGRRQVDTRAAVLSISVVDPASLDDAAARSVRVRHGRTASYAILHVVVRHTTPSVRPDDIVTAWRSVANFAPAAPVLVTRLAQGPLNEESCSVEDPLRSATGAVDVLERREPTGDAHPEA